MRSSISAQSWASVPPAPALTCTTAGPASYSPVNSAASWSASISLTHAANAARRARSPSTRPPRPARPSSAGRRARRARRSNRSSSRASFARSALTLPAARASSQNPGAEISVVELVDAGAQRVGVKGNHGPRRAGPSTPRRRPRDPRVPGAVRSRRTRPWRVVESVLGVRPRVTASYWGLTPNLRRTEGARIARRVHGSYGDARRCVTATGTRGRVRVSGMARQPRERLRIGFYHVYSRGTGGLVYFEDDADHHAQYDLYGARRGPRTAGGSTRTACCTRTTTSSSRRRTRRSSAACTCSARRRRCA